MKDTVSIPRKGGISDLNMMNIPEGSFLFCMNGSMEAKSADSNIASVSNDGSNILAVNFPQGFAVIGRVHITEQNRTIYALINPTTGVSQIGEVRDCAYDDDSDDTSGSDACADCDIPIQIIGESLENKVQIPYCSYIPTVSSACLGFDINYPVRIKYRITDCSLNIYFTDRKSGRRFIYFDYNEDGTLKLQDRFKVINGFDTNNCDQPIYSDELDCNKILYHPSYGVPCIDLVEVSTGGSLKAGMYQFLAAYSDVSGNPMSDFTAANNPIPISTKQITFATNYDTDKSIVLKLTNLDTTSAFGYYTVVVAKTIDNFTSFEKIGVFPVTQSAIVYTGNEILEKLTADDLFFKRTFYEKAGNVTNANNYLFFSDLTEFHKPNLQRVANNVKLYWQTVAIPEAVYRRPENTFRFRSCDRDEVYPYGIIFTMDNGQEYGPYHIPSLSKSYLSSNYGTNVDQIINNEDVQQDTSCNEIERNKKWQVYNTAFVVGTPHEVAQNCESNKVWEWGEFAYWESINTYPNDPEIWGDLCGEPIRHHKFPDSLVTHIHNGLNGAKTFFDSNIVYPIGVRIDNNSVKTALTNAVSQGIISQQDRDRITGYRIVRGNRVGNESNIAKGLLFDMWRYTKNNKTSYYPNYPYNDLRRDYFIAPTSNTYQGSNTSNPQPSTFTSSKRYTFHSPDTHFKEPTIGTEIKLETEEYGQAEGFFNHCEDQAKYKFLSTAATTLALAAGVAAAFAGEKNHRTECKTIINRNYQGIILALGSGATTPAVPIVQTPFPIFAQGVDGIPNPLAPAKYDPITGLQIPNLLDPSYLQATEVQQQTCRSKTRHLLNPASLSPASIFLQELIYIGILSMEEMKIIEDLIRALTPFKNFAIQYNSVGKYNNYKTIANSGNKIRNIDRSAYLEPNNQLINEAINTTTDVFSNVFINNWNRERSVYLKTDTNKSSFPSPSVVDTSRFTMDNINFKQEDLLKKTYSTVSSYYGSIKRFVPDQYGHISDIQYVETNGCNFNLAATYGVSETSVFGGDKFITRFALKRKMPFFLQTRFRQINQSDAEYSELGNVGFPNYYHNTEVSLMQRLGSTHFNPTNIMATFQDIIGIARTRLDARKSKFFYQSGFIHLYNYGIPYFLVESDINTDYRHGENNLEKDFYPHQQDLEFWLQEKNVPITEDNYYFYNKTYSKQNKESFIGTQLNGEDLRECTVTHPSRVISSLPSSKDPKIDNWLTFRPNDFFDFPLQNGKLVGIDGIESDKVLARFENTSQIFNAYDVLQTSDKEIQVGNGGLFATRPKEFSVTSLGYAGTQNTDLLQTEFGHIWPDAKRGQIFMLGSNASSLKDLTVEGVSGWFNENLKFRIKQDFPNIELKNLDNNYKGIGLHLSFDKRFKRMFLTKLDYKRLDKSIEYRPSENEFYLHDEKISLYDERFFCNKSFTVSYNFLTKNWIWHSFIPNYYLDNIDYIQAGRNFVNRGRIESSLWSHNLTNKSYQVYFGQLCPFIVEVPSEPAIVNSVLNSITFDTDAIRYHNHYDYSFDRTVTFNKAWVYNDRQHSGELELIVRNENDMSASISYPKVEAGKQQILVTNKNNKWNFNQFWDVVNTQKGNIPFVLNTCSNVDKILNLPALNYFKSDMEKQSIRGRQTRLRLIQDKASTHRLQLNTVQEEKTNG